jgi:hypothetical protein
MANRKNTLATTAEDTVDRRPCVPGLYRRVLPVACLREVTHSPRFVHHALRDEKDPQHQIEAAQIEAQAAQLAAERLAEGAPIEAWHYDLKNLPAPFDQLAAPLDKLGFDPSPRRMTITPDDRVDATAHFESARTTYERARYSRTCDHSYFQAAFAQAAEWGVG